MLKNEENKSHNDLNRLMNGLGNKKSFRDVDQKFANAEDSIDKVYKSYGDGHAGNDGLNAGDVN